MARTLSATRLQNDPCYTSCLILVWEWAFAFSVPFSSARHVPHAMAIFFHAMNHLIFSDGSDDYGLKSVGGFEGIALAITGVGRLGPRIIN